MSKNLTLWTTFFFSNYNLTAGVGTESVRSEGAGGKYIAPSRRSTHKESIIITLCVFTGGESERKNQNSLEDITFFFEGFTFFFIA